jgi:arylsulfate sulfotransferase
MKMPNKTLSFLIGLLAAASAPAFATVSDVTLKAKPASPEAIGKSITFTATAADSNTGPLAFQFNITPPGGSLTMVKDFNVGTLSGSTWTAPSFVWVPTGVEGSYKIQVVAKDFVSGKSASKTITFIVDPLVTGTTPVVEKTSNPLVALFSAPSCPAGSTMRVYYQVQTASAKPIQSGTTNYMGCHPPASMTFEVSGLYPSTAYNMYAETKTGGTITNGPTLSFTSGALPKKTVPFPTFTGTKGTDTANPVLLHNFITFGTGTIYPDVATDLDGNVIWYYYSSGVSNSDLLTRPLPGGGTISIQNDVAWNPNVNQAQFLRQIDLAGNIVRETNMGVIQQELLALGSEGGPCTAIATPAPIGAACTGAFHHDAIQTLPNGYTAALIDIERIYPAGTQGDTSGLPVDIVGDMIIVLNTNWQVVWYWDVFDPTGGGQGYSLLPVSQTAILGETCGSSTAGCPPIFLLDPGSIAPLAHDWLHGNSLYYWPAPEDGNTTGGDLVFSTRHQDTVFKIDYKDGAGTGNLLWAMGSAEDGHVVDFTFVNTYNDPWPWFSHQHDVQIQSGGTNPMTLMDNGNTRVSNPPTGLGTNCSPYDCDSRGMALTVDYTTMTVTPLLSVDLGGYSTAMGSADMLSDGNYFFENAIVFDISAGKTYGYSLEVAPTPAAPQVGPADFLMDLAGPQHYRGWQMPSLYNPPIT